MNRITHIIANGCSMTEGAELGNVEHNYDESLYGPSTWRGSNYVTEPHKVWMEQHAYPFILGSLMNVIPSNNVNLAQGSSSNRRIIRTTFDYLTNHNLNPRTTLVLFGLSTIDRYELLEGTVIHPVVPNTMSGYGNFKKWHQVFTNEADDYLETRERHMMEFNHLLQQHLIDIATIKSNMESQGYRYLISHGIFQNIIRVYFGIEWNFSLTWHSTPTMDRLWELVRGPNLYRSMEYATLKEYIGALRLKMNSPANDLNFCSYAYNNNFKMGNGTHPLEEAHASWASVLYDYILDNDI